MRATKGALISPAAGGTAFDKERVLALSFFGEDGAGGRVGLPEVVGVALGAFGRGTLGGGILGGAEVGGFDVPGALDDGAAGAVDAGAMTGSLRIGAEEVVALVVCERASFFEGVSSSFLSPLTLFSNETSPGFAISPLSILPSCPVFDRPHEKSLPLAVSARE